MYLAPDATESIGFLIEALNENYNGIHSFVPNGGLTPNWSNKSLSGVVIRSTTDDTLITAGAVLREADPWVQEVRDQIDVQRKYVSGWDGQDAEAPSFDALDIAEELADAFAYLPMRERPQYALDTDGRPTFSLYNDRIYLHLTVENDNLISWYSVIDEKEFFGEVTSTEISSEDFARRVIPS